MSTPSTNLEQPTGTPAQISAIDFCHKWKIPFFYCRIIYKEVDGKQKKQITGLPSGYMTMNYYQSQNCHKKLNSTHINIIIKNSPTHKLVVVDTDSQSGYDSIKANPKFILTAETQNINRPGHAHLYYLVDQLPGTKIVKTHDNLDIDLIIDNIFEPINACFTMEPSCMSLADILPVFKPALQPINLIITGINSVPVTKPTNPLVIPPIIPVIEQVITEPSITFSLAERIISGLNPKEFESYGAWASFVYCIYNISQTDPINKDNYFQQLNKFLSKCSNYNELENFKFFYMTAKDSVAGISQITVRSLWYWLKTQNIELYKQLLEEDKPDGMIDPEYFATKFKNNYPRAKKYFESIFFKLNNPAGFCYFDNIAGDYHFKCAQDMAHITHNFWFYYSTEKEPNGKCKFYQKWLDDTTALTYNYIKLVPPPLKCHPKTLNLFTGFIAEKIPACEPVSIQVILNHIKLLCEDSTEYADYTINFLAHILQKPAELTRTALVFKGAQGAGKGLFFNWFANNILGPKYYYTTANPDNIVKNNDHLNGKILVNMDEAHSRDMYASASTIKNMITEPTITLSNKYIKPFCVENYCRYIFFSNMDNPVKVEDNDRRFIVYKTSDKIARLQDQNPVKVDYFKTLREEMKKPMVIYTFYKFLMDRDISQVDWTARPMTDSYNFSRELNTPLFAEFIESYCWDTDYITFDASGLNITTKATFFKEFNKFLERTKSTTMVMRERAFQIECKKYNFIKSILVGEARLRGLEINRNEAFAYLQTNNYLRNPHTEYCMD